MNNPNTPIPNNLVWAILSTLFCCLPLGVVSIIYAAKVDGLAAAGDIQGAQQASDNAKKWAIISAVALVALAVIYILFAVVLGALGAM